MFCLISEHLTLRICLLQGLPEPLADRLGDTVLKRNVSFPYLSRTLRHDVGRRALP